jgi:hypothetical protein
MALAALAVFVAELAANAAFAGGPWRRFEMVRYWHSGQYMAADYPTTSTVLYRLFLELPARLVSRGQGWAAVAALAAGIPLAVRGLPGARTALGWFAAIYAGYSFWPSSLSPFLPGFHLFDWTLPVLAAPLAVLLGAALSRLELRLAVPALLLLAAHNLFLTHEAWTRDRRFTEGPREARAWIEKHRPARVAADDKTVEALDFFDGHDPRRRYLRFQDPDALAGSIVIVDAFWTAPGAWWSRPVPELVRRPPPGWKKIYESPRLVIYRT